MVMLAQSMLKVINTAGRWKSVTHNRVPAANLPLLPERLRCLGGYYLLLASVRATAVYRSMIETRSRRNLYQFQKPPVKAVCPIIGAERNIELLLINY